MRRTIVFAVSVLLVAALLVVLALAGIAHLHRDRVAVLRLPPPSIAQWYKPQSKRHVFLHTMFKLRREMQAVRGFVEAQDLPRARKWTDRFAENYVKIAEMVPEWEGEIDRATLSTLTAAVDTGDRAAILESVRSIEQSCQSCHDQYRVVTALLHRAPDFSDSPNSGPEEREGYADLMRTLSEQVNTIMISSEEGDLPRAREALSELTEGMAKLGHTCEQCHKRGTPVYPDANLTELMNALGDSLVSGEPKDQRRRLGAVAVEGCANCHGIHRLLSESRRLLTHRPSLPSLLRH